MTVSELIAELSKFDGDLDVHLDISLPDDERTVRHIEYLTLQGGFTAVALRGYKTDVPPKK